MSKAAMLRRLDTIDKRIRTPPVTLEVPAILAGLADDELHKIASAIVLASSAVDLGWDAARYDEAARRAVESLAFAWLDDDMPYDTATCHHRAAVMPHYEAAVAAHFGYRVDEYSRDADRWAPCPGGELSRSWLHRLDETAGALLDNVAAEM